MKTMHGYPIARGCEGPQTCKPDDRFVVINTATGELIETHFTEYGAATAAGWLNDHERKCHRPRVYQDRPAPCPRTLAIYMRGVPMPDVPHHFAYTGDIPNTGTLRCTLCGTRKD